MRPSPFAMSEIPRPSWSYQVLGVHDREWSVLATAFATFFALLCGYYMVRPIRETMAIAIGTQHGHWLFTGTFVVMLSATPLFGWVASVFRRGLFVPGVFWVFVASLFAFSQAFKALGTPAMLAALFYIWISVANYFLVSVFWSVMADVFRESQGRRLFALIAAGGTLGAITGPLITSAFVQSLGQPGIMIAAAVVICLVPLGLLRMLRSTNTPTAKGEFQPDAANMPPNESETTSIEAPLGGSVWEGVRQTLSSRYLLRIGIYTLLAGVVGSTIYLMQNAYVEASNLTVVERTQFFARADSATNVLTLVFELLLTGPLMRYFGVGPSLVALPLVAILGLPFQAVYPSLYGIAILQVIRRATEYAIAKPGREVLFTVLPAIEKYKAKNFIDTVLARAGDVVSSWSRAILAFTATDVNLAFPLAILVSSAFGYLGWQLSRDHKRLSSP
jgi:ATP:ADP antiporter, AAA family